MGEIFYANRLISPLYVKVSSARHFCRSSWNTPSKLAPSSAGIYVLAGCDFLQSVLGIGITRSYNLVAKYHNLDRSIWGRGGRNDCGETHGGETLAVNAYACLEYP
ncbi:hypothetical protein CQW23_14038 [Capsicum baccatum]|uniref:Uncharacterized protein n=1 Tax=Capsicum baccatum TaxID=33114 RepID=A0A2G2WIA7_CAPBA|nr:hypothetical protein CQW23_14038 [Capsicum baccatum]